MAQINFDTNSVEKRDNNYELLPAGWYTAQVSESAINQLKSGNGQALKLTFDVLSDTGRGRKVWAQLNIQHTNPKTETIAQQQLRELCEAVGIVRMTDTVELHNKPVQIRVKIRKSEDPQYEDSNEIAGFKAAGQGTGSSMAPMPGGTFPTQPRAAAPAAAPVPTAAAPAATGSAPPWAKR